MNTLTSTRHTLDFNALSYEKFEELCFWLVEDSGEYQSVEYYGGTGDKKRDVIGHDFDGELDYFQCKRYDNPTYSILKEEIDGMLGHIQAGEIKKPRRVYFVLSSPASPEAKDKTKKYAQENELPEPVFWEPVILDKKMKKNPDALKNFFGIVNEEDQRIPQVDTIGLIAYGSDETRFTIINNGNENAVDCRWCLIGFGWPGYQVETIFNLKPGEERELRIAMPGDFMKTNPIKELRLHFEYRDGKNNWYYSERKLVPELVKSGAFYRINQMPGNYVPAKPLFKRFNIDAIGQMAPTGLNATYLVSYTHDDVARNLRISISTTLAAMWHFSSEEGESAVKELAERKILQMIRTGNFEDEFYVNSYLRPTQKTGFESYQELRDSII